MTDDFMAQDPYTFDQTEKGWRSLDKQGAYLEAAQLIEAYLRQNKQRIADQKEVSAQTIHFHAGQEYAMCGEQYYAKAASFIEQSYKQREDWDIYVKGTVAFLNKDIATLTSCANLLTKLATSDIRQESNANLLTRFLCALERSGASYGEVYGE